MSRTRSNAHKQTQRKLRPGTFTPILNDVLTNPDISPTAFRVLMYLATKPETWVANTADIVSATGLTKYAVREVARPELGDLGFLMTADVRDEHGKVIRKETRLVRGLVVYVGNGAGQSLRREIPDAGEAVAWIDTPEVSQNGDVSPGQDLRREIPDSGNPRLLVSTESAVSTEGTNNIDEADDPWSADHIELSEELCDESPLGDDSEQDSLARDPWSDDDPWGESDREPEPAPTDIDDLVIPQDDKYPKFSKELFDY